MQKVWCMKEQKRASFEMPDMHPATGILLAQRGIESQEEAEKFFKPNWETDTHDPFLFSQMRASVERVLEGLKRGEHITVFGDYDADGVTGSTVVISTLRKIVGALGAGTASLRSQGAGTAPLRSIVGAGLPCPGAGTASLRSIIDSYIPHRDAEGYGLNMDVIPVLKGRGTSLLITVDCGISCVEEIALAKELGIDTIVLDHHRFGDELPNCILIHPSIPNETYPFKHLAAVGVAWKFASALITFARESGIEIQDGWEKWMLDLVAIATVTDMVPLEGENRALLKYGLLVLNKTRRLGLLSLIELSRIEQGKISSETVGFTIGPRINAAGRMDHADRALELLLSDSPTESHNMAIQLESLNRMRQKTTGSMMEVVDAILKESEMDPVVVLYDPTWSPALVGLVAGRVSDMYARPCLAIGKHGERWIGSGRSPKSINITEFVQITGEGLLARSGGHAQACGFAFDSNEAVLTFIERVKVGGEKIRCDLLEGPQLEIDIELKLSDLTWKLWDMLQRFEPFGMGNAKPKFCSNNLRVISADQVGKTKSHLRVVVMDDDGRSRSFIGFKLGARHTEITLGERINVVYDVGTNVWNGREELSCKIIDFQPVL